MWCGELEVEVEWVHQVQTSLNTESHRKHFYPKQTKKNLKNENYMKERNSFSKYSGGCSI